MIIFNLNLDPLKPLYQPNDTIQKFDSFVWTERYQEAGDFQLVVENDILIRSLLPLGSLISHTDTKEVMIVENHELERDTKKTLKVKISGRSFETFSENRNVPDTNTGYIPLYDAAGTTQTPDLIITAAAENVILQLLKKGLEQGTAPANDYIPNLVIRTAIRVLDSSMVNVIKRGNTYSKVLEYLRLSDSGIKMLRPNGAQTTMDIVIHDGLDKIASVIFYAQYEDLEDAKYFWSNKGHKNYAQVATHTSARLYKDRSLGATELTGLNRRILYVDDDKILGNFTTPSNTDAVGAFAQINLDDNKKVSLMQAKISNTAKPKFKFDYDIGDLVTVFGEFAMNQQMRVTEHVLTVDKDGIKGYPSLSFI